MSQTKNVSKGIIIGWTLVFLLLILIFSLSAQPAVESNQSSLRVTEVIVAAAAKVIAPDLSAKKMERIVLHFNNLVRKLAHISLYFVLGMLVLYAIRKTGCVNYRMYLITILLCMLYAVTDEWHQTFVSGRSGQVSDVLIDTAGSLAGIGVYVLWLKLRKK